MGPTADQVARIILAACREHGEDWEDLLGGRAGVLARATAYMALAAAFPALRGASIARMLGANGSAKENSLVTNIKGQVRANRPQVHPDLVARVMRAVEVGGQAADKEPTPVKPPSLQASSPPPAPPGPPELAAAIAPSVVEDVAEFGRAMVEGKPVFVPAPMTPAELRAAKADLKSRIEAAKRAVPADTSSLSSIRSRQPARHAVSVTDAIFPPGRYPASEDA